MDITHRTALARKWRPKSFDTVVGQEHVVRALSNALDHNLLHHAYLFTGTRGVGKTTLARIFAKCLNCENKVSSAPCGQCEPCQEIDNGRFPDLYEIDAASRTKVEDTREILDNIQYAPVKGRFKIYLIDEVHMLSGHSFNALLKTLEEPPEHVKFLLATTDPQKLPPTVLSRCLQFHLTPMPAEEIAEHFQHLMKEEAIVAEPTALALLAKAAQGSMRDGLSLLDQSIAFGNNQVMADDVKKMLGTIDNSLLEQIIAALSTQDAEALIACSANLARQGANFQQALGDLLSLLHQITILQIAPNAANSTNSANLQAFSQQLTAENIQLYYQIALIGQKDISLAPNAQIGFEMTLLRMLTFTPQHDSIQDSSATISHSSLNKNKKKTTTPAVTENKAISSEWLEIINQLNLPGATTALLRACAMESLNNEELHLTLAPSHQALLNQKHLDRINKALPEYFNKTVRVNIELKDSDTPSANKMHEQQQKLHKEASKASLLADKNIQSMMKTFEANVVNTSVATDKGNLTSGE